MKTNYNETDYKNALSVIRQCERYVREVVAPYQGKSDFPWVVDLLYMCENEGNRLRGRWKGNLAIEQSERYCNLIVHGKYADGFGTMETIYSSDSPYKYAYNSNAQTTIDVGVYLAKNWGAIKSKLDEILSAYQKNSSANSDILSGFTI